MDEEEEDSHYHKIKKGKEDDTDAYAVFDVTVTDPKISATKLSLIPGTSEKLTVNGTATKPIFYSENEVIATVSEDGTVTAVDKGAGQKTTVHTEVDGLDIWTEVIIEAFPQLATFYVTHGESGMDDGHSIENDLVISPKEYISLSECTIEVTEGAEGAAKDASIRNGKYQCFTGEIENIANINDVAYNENTCPVYRMTDSEKMDNTSITIPILGTSREATVTAKKYKLKWFYQGNGEAVRAFAESTDKVKVTYEAGDHYGIITLKSAPKRPENKTGELFALHESLEGNSNDGNYDEGDVTEDKILDGVYYYDAEDEGDTGFDLVTIDYGSFKMNLAVISDFSDFMQDSDDPYVVVANYVDETSDMEVIATSDDYESFGSSASYSYSGGGSGVDNDLGGLAVDVGLAALGTAGLPGAIASAVIGHFLK